MAADLGANEILIPCLSLTSSDTVIIRGLLLDRSSRHPPSLAPASLFNTYSAAVTATPDRHVLV